MQNYEEAIKTFDKAIGIKADVFSLWVNKGLALLQLKIPGYPRRLQQGNHARRRRPELESQGYTYEEMGRQQEALEGLRQGRFRKTDYIGLKQQKASCSTPWATTRTP